MDDIIAFYSIDDVKDSCRIKFDAECNRALDDGVKDDIHSIKMVMGEYFENIAFATNELTKKVNDLVKKQNEIDTRISKVELVTESTIEEIIQYYLYIFQNTDDDIEDLKQKLVDDVGKNSMIFTLKKMKKVIETKNVDSSIKERIAKIIESMENGDTTDKMNKIGKLEGKIEDLTKNLNKRNTENRKLQDVVDKLGLEKEELQNQLNARN